MLDSHTFGSSKAAAILVEKLNKLDDAKLTRRVSRFLARTFTGFAELSAIEDDHWFREFRVFWRNHRLSMINFHPELNTYIANLIRTNSKEWAREIK